MFLLKHIFYKEDNVKQERPNCVQKIKKEKVYSIAPPCEVCGKIFNRSVSLKRHINEAPMKDIKIIGNAILVGHFSIHTSANLKTHIKIIHEGSLKVVHKVVKEQCKFCKIEMNKNSMKS